MTAVRVLLCYPERLLRTALRSVLETDAGVRVAGEAGDGFEAVAKARGLRPDVAIVDEALPGLDGIQVITRLGGDPLAEQVRTIFLTERPDAMFEAVQAGASGFLLRSSDQDELVWAVRAVAAGEAFLAPRAASMFLRHYRRRGARHQAAKVAEGLTEREREVLVLVADGLNNTEIAAKLYVSEATVKFHISNLLSKLQVRDRLQAAVYAHKAGVV
ncbi:Transcriptional regulatory protein LiaR [Nonomuraea coxensis DSM 45129]|uniref:Transcriptional regulatory protein LiaR n=1 Tax=Nonomuraea coxensis DSM 45129 TaxID=1122611 RepID=A0ABX8U2B3_9ACTN|nr:response regulator transcription factor [Nonomuraea coxensis]QYC41606.1 Transcriptional regulatory protein LiaR [Nonomuraea coxensis DSM 45129]